MNEHSSKCHFCNICDGNGCIGELPGMGGISNNANFKLNYQDWKKISRGTISHSGIAKIRLGPMTGAVENIGYEDEVSFYYDLLKAVHAAGVSLSLGDGYPDLKLLSGIEAIKKIQLSFPSTKAAVFIKPYTNNKIYERIEWAKEVNESIGIDIDSYNIITMRNLVNLEQKTAQQLIEVKKHVKTPFIIKGIFNKDEISLVQEVKPDVVVISNHGGRVDNRTGSTADFLSSYGQELAKYCGELWVDGGLRNKQDIEIASSYGVSEVLIGRPFVTALCAGGEKAVHDLVSNSFL